MFYPDIALLLDCTKRALENVLPGHDANRTSSSPQDLRQISDRWQSVGSRTSANPRRDPTGKTSLGGRSLQAWLGRTIWYEAASRDCALLRLERDGLLESRPRAGSRVKIPTVAETRGKYQVREALECHSARLCAEHSTFEERLDLKRLAASLDTLFTHASFEISDKEFLLAVQKSHFDLNMKIVECGRCEALKSAIESSHILAFNWLYDNASGRNSLPDSSHQTLIDAIITGDPEAAESEMQAHVSFGLDQMI